MRNSLLNLVVINNVDVTLTCNGNIRCVKGYVFPDGIERLIYKNYNIEFKSLSRIKYCVKDFLKFYEETINDIKEYGFQVENLS